MHGTPCFIVCWDIRWGQEVWCKHREFHPDGKLTTRQLENKAYRFARYLRKCHGKKGVKVFWA
jgi:hypothetical protein